MIYLPDVNFWIALTSTRHPHSAHAVAWMGSKTKDQVVFCRITELGLLRLLTNSHVMGSEVKDHVGAWQVYDQIRADVRIDFLTESPGLSARWSRARHQLSGGSNALTDAYLAIFARHENATVVTFDRRFNPIDGSKILTLPI